MSWHCYVTSYFNQVTQGFNYVYGNKSLVQVTIVSGILLQENIDTPKVCMSEKLQ